MVRIGPPSLDGDVLGAFENLQAALEYVDRNAVANTDYLIRVEEDDPLPRVFLAAGNQENVTIRLRGHGGERRLKNDNDKSNNSYDSTVHTPAYLTSKGWGFFTIGQTNGNVDNKELFFILENNITVEGVGVGTTPSLSYNSLIYVERNATLVMKQGSKLTGHTTTTTSFDHAAVHIFSQYNPAAKDQGALRLEGGSITHCSFDPDSSLIFSNYKDHAPGLFYMAGNDQFFFGSNTDNTLVLHRKYPDPMDGVHYGRKVDLENYVSNGLTVP
jgi:hypothetical protein